MFEQDIRSTYTYEEPAANKQLVLLSDTINQFVEAHTSMAATEDHTPLDTENVVVGLLNEADIWTVLGRKASNVAGVKAVVHAMNELEIATGGETPWLLQIAQSIDKQQLTLTLGELFEREDPALNAILERAVSKEEQSYTAEKSLLLLVADIVGPAFGTTLQWDDRQFYRRRPVPPFMRRITERSYFPRICFDDQLEIIKQIPAGSYQQLYQARIVQEKLLGDVMKMTGHEVYEFQLASGHRTSVSNGDPEVPVEKSLLVDEWQTTMESYIRHVQHFGLERIRQLRRDWGIVNLDRYSQKQLQRMCRLSDGDPVLIEELRNGDVTLVSADAFGDETNGIKADVAALESDDETTLYSEITAPDSLYTPLVKLGQRYGILASIWAVPVHGDGGFVGFGNGRQLRRFDIVPVPDSNRKTSFGQGSYAVSRSQFARLVRTYMRPHSVTGERLVAVLACNQVARDSNRRSIPEQLAHMTQPADRVAVAGWAGELCWNDNQLWDAVRDEQAQAVTYRKVSSVAVRASISRDVAGLRVRPSQRQAMALAA